jgi:hypothetical protein
MIDDTEYQSDYAKLLELLNSDEFKQNLTIETLQSNNYKLIQEHIKFGLDYNVVREREQLIINEINFWKKRSLSTDFFFEKTYPLFWPSLKLMSTLKPISVEMLVGFISGWAMLRFFFSPSKLSIYEDEEIEKLMRPSLIILKDFFSTQLWQEYLINLAILESSIITIKFNSCIEETVNTREAILSFIREKKITPFNKHQIEMLKMDYKKEQMLYVEPLENVSKESKKLPIKSKPGRKPSSFKSVEEWFIKIDGEDLNKLLLQLKILSKDFTPKQFVFMIKALDNLGYLKPYENKAIFDSFEKFFGIKYGVMSAKNANMIRANNARTTGSLDNLLPSLERTISEIIKTINMS